MSGYRIGRLRNTAIYQGAGKTSRYFEGWYFKHVSPDGRVYSVIPGVALGGADPHAFIQLIDGNTADTRYYPFPVSDFTYSKDRFEIAIGPNTFSAKGISLAIGKDGTDLRARIAFGPFTGLPATLFSPNIMGWYSYVPFMECYHGLVSMDHRIDGHLTLDGKTVVFDGGRGYAEKDWGRSFPSSWVWMQSNQFESPGNSFMLSIARIPWLGRHFTGFLGFHYHGGRLRRFGTYTGARLSALDVGEDSVSVSIGARDFSLRITARKSRKGILKAPVNGIMERRIAESIDAMIDVEVSDPDGTVITKESGTHGGLEIVGTPEELTTP